MTVQYLLVLTLFCADIDECATDQGGCSEVCENTAGSFKCSCSRPGFELAANNLDCMGKKASTSIILFGCSILCGHLSLSLSLSPSLDSSDTNECLSADLNNCDQTCSNTNGGYVCSCQSGFKLNEDGFSCDRK